MGASQFSPTHAAGEVQLSALSSESYYHFECYCRWVAFIVAVVEVPKGWSVGLPPLAVRHVSMGKPLVVAGELADIRIIMSQLQTILAEEGLNQVSVMVYNTGSRSSNFTMMQSVMTIVTLAPIPRKVHCTLLIVPQKNGNLTIERSFATPVILSNLYYLFSCRCTLRSVKAHYPASCVLRLFNGCWRFRKSRRILQTGCWWGPTPQICLFSCTFISSQKFRLYLVS